MEKILTQEEIDALFRAAHGTSAASSRRNAERQIEPWDLRQASRLTKEQINTVSQLHESFARNLSHSLGAYLRSKFTVTLVSAEQLAYRDFLARLPDLTYHASFLSHPGENRAVAQMDSSLAFPVVDLLLGGRGQAQPQTREMSEIEELILGGVGQIICHELQSVWQPMGVTFEFEKRQPASQVQRVMSAQEKTLTLSFEVTMADSHGMLNLAFPALLSSSLLRRLSTEWSYQGTRTHKAKQESIMKRMLNSPVELSLCTPAVPVQLTDLLMLRPGLILPLQLSIGEPAMVRFAGRECWQARVVRTNTNGRAAHLVGSIAQPEER
jgi:flagellar motor switch protein FliM